MTVDAGPDIIVTSNRPTLCTTIWPAYILVFFRTKGSVVMYSGEDDFRTQTLFVVWIMYVATKPIFSLSVDTVGKGKMCRSLVTGAYCLPGSSKSSRRSRFGWLQRSQGAHFLWQLCAATTYASLCLLTGGDSHLTVYTIQDGTSTASAQFVSSHTFSS